MTDMNAALGLIQLKKQPEFQKKRTQIAQHYNTAFNHCPNITPITTTPDSQSAWHLYVIKVNQDRHQLIEQLKEKGILCSVHFIPVYMHPFYKKKFNYKQSDYPVSNTVFNTCLSLPIYPNLTHDQVNYITETVTNVVQSPSKTDH
jgi:dTDP-4-amino-4,6-dideoxygalactose transaminase